MSLEIKEIEEWKALRVKIDTSYDYNDNWERALQLFSKRLNRKFFNPLERIIKERVQQGEGFAILVVQCALIEMFSAFRKGKIYNHMKKKDSPKYEYNSSKQIFKEFLHNAPIFENVFFHFDEKGKRIKDFPFSSEHFYTEVRCGLVHEARTKGLWFINTTMKNVKTEKIFIEKSGGKLKIYRTILHYRLKLYLSHYLEELRDNSENGRELRKYFARKLDHLFEIQADKNKFDWWKE